MICILNTATDPTFNLAAEEYLMTNGHEDCFMLWRNQPAVIVGRNQNTHSQINAEFIAREKIPVVRRISGGGAVYHDLGNVNYTFIRSTGPALKLEFNAYMHPARDYLRALGVPVEFDGRNDMALKGRKISGNAQHVRQGRVLHHGTILYDADLEALTSALLVDPVKYIDKAVDSVRKRVTNVRIHLPLEMPVETFMEGLMAHILNANGARRWEFSDADRKAIEAIADDRYRTWEWNFGRSPDYNFIKTSRTAGGTLEVRMTVTGGIIRNIRLFGDYFGVRDVGELEGALAGCRHDREAVAGVLAGHPVGDYLHNIRPEELTAALF